MESFLISIGVSNVMTLIYLYFYQFTCKYSYAKFITCKTLSNFIEIRLRIIFKLKLSLAHEFDK